MSSSTVTVFLRTAAVLWIVWGLVHLFAGIMTISQDTVSAVQGIADAADPASLAMDYPEAVGAVINQHGFNLAWIGAATFIGAFFIWRRVASAIFVVALVGWLADVGYFLFLDLGGFVKFVPGTVMTILSTVAVVLSFLAYFRGTKPAAAVR